MPQAPLHSQADIVEIFPGDSEISNSLRAYDWASTALGSPENWPASLKTAVHIALTSRFPLWVGCGKDLHIVYNQGFTQVLADKHPWAAGRPVREVWHEVWDVISPMLMGVLERGEASWLEDSLLILQRKNNTPEETYFTYSYSPIKEGQDIVGVFTTVAETTERVIGERRLKTLRDLGAQATSKIDSSEAACQAAMEILSKARLDIPYAALFLADDSDQGFRFRETTLPGVDSSFWPVKEVLQSGTAQLLENVSDYIKVPDPHWERPIDKIMVLPLGNESHKEGARGVFVAGVSPLRPLDEEYRGYFELVANQIGTGIANAKAYEDERKRAEELAELDRAKTAFFSNVSHEFRTPLTLMLGPIEDAMQDTETVPRNRERMEVAHRNALRLQKLVNTLLDFSRIEAGRVQALYRPTDLASYTAELASMFRSAVEKAGLRFMVDCPQLPESIYVDRDMWEKIVLNLLSNAFKHTFKGEIEVRLGWENGQAKLSVRDTGVGIPPEEVPHLFERFHRVPNARSRTHEGSGIGLALVNELVKLHGGSVHVKSVLSQGTTFTITVPSGKAHLPAGRVEAQTTLATTAIAAQSFVEEALRWLPEEQPRLTLPGSEAENVQGVWFSTKPHSDAKARILLADDNADMRDYVRSLLQPHCDIETVTDGAKALEAVRREPPDLILSDVMMPEMDGFELLRALRKEARLRTIPVILLSARAGEEAKVEGIQAGADDYLVKPFNAKELLARVKANIDLYRVRQEAAEAIRQSEERYSLVVQGTNEGIWDWDIENETTYWNDRFYEILGLKREDVPNPHGVFGWKLIHPEDLPIVEKTMKAHLEQGVPYKIELRMRHVSGGYRYLRASAQAVWNEAGVPVRVAGAVADITDQKTAEIALKESEERFRIMADASPILIWMLDDQLNTVYFNKALLEFYGQTLEEAVEIGWEPYVHPDDKDSLMANLHKALEAREPFTVEARVRRHDGAFRWQIAFGVPRFNSQGEFLGYIGSAIDFTERKEAENALRRSQTQLQDFFDTATLGLHWVGPDGTIIRANQAELDMLGYSKEEYIGHHIGEFHADAPVIDDILNRLCQGEKLINYPARLRCKDGSIKHVLINSSVYWENDQFIHTRCFTRDVTELVQATEALRESERRYRLLLSGITDYAIFMEDSQGNITSWDEGAQRLFGYTAEEIIGQPISKFHLPEDIEANMMAKELEIATREGRIETEGLRVRKDGSCFRAKSVLRAIHDESNNLIGFAKIVQDITELRQSEEYFRATFQSSVVPIFIIDLDGKFIRTNDACSKIYGYSEEEFKSLSIPDITHPEDAAKSMEMVGRLIKGEISSFVLEKRYLRKNNMILWSKSSVSLVHDEQGKPQYLIAVVEDITERKRIDLILHGQKQALEQAVNGESLSVVLDTIATGAETQSVSGLKASILLIDVDGKHLRHGGAPSLPEWYNELVDGVAIGPDVGTCGRAAYIKQEVVVTDMANDPNWAKFKDAALSLNPLASWSTPIFSSKGRLLGTFGVYYPRVQEPTPEDREAVTLLARTAGLIIEWHHDIEEREKAKDLLSESEERFRLIANAAPSFVWTLGPDGSQTYLNEYGLKFFGTTLEEFLKNSWPPYLHPDDIEAASQALQEAIRSRLNYRFEHRVRRWDGEYRWVLSTAAPSFLPDGRIYGYVGSSLDITDRKQAEEELLNYSRLLERSNKELEEFATIASHDLQAPLRKVMTFSDMLQSTLEGQLPPEAESYIDRIQKSTGKMQELITDLLALSRVTRHNNPFKTTDLKEIINDVLEELDLAIQEKNAAIELGPLCTVEADPSQMKQIFNNLIGNSLKFSRDSVPPKIQISAHLVKDCCEIIVQDNGIGFKPELGERIFKAFERGHGKSVYPGTGIGLTIVRKIVERHSGTITASGVPNEGATFVIRLPLKQEKPSSREKAELSAPGL